MCSKITQPRTIISYHRTLTRYHEIYDYDTHTTCRININERNHQDISQIKLYTNKTLKTNNSAPRQKKN